MADSGAYGLRGLSKERIEQAIQKVNTDNLDKDWQLKLLGKDLQDAAILFMKDNFLPYEPLVQLFGVHWDKDTEEYWKSVFDQGLTLILTNKNDDELIALRGVDVVKMSDRVETAGISDENHRHLLEYLNYCDDHAKFFEHYGVEEAIHFAGLAVSQAYRRRGIAAKLTSCAVNFVENIGLKCVYIKGEASSDYSKRVYEKLDFDELYHQIYGEYTVNGKHLMLDKTPHTSNKIYGKRLELSR